MLISSSFYGEEVNRGFFFIMKRPDKELAYEALNGILDFFGRGCVRCGYSDARALQIDHVYGGGRKEKRNGNRWYYRKILLELTKGIDGGRYQLLCANCNWIKKFENKLEKGGRRPKSLC